MTDLRQAAQQALEALEFDRFTPEDLTHRYYTKKAITALRTALAMHQVSEFAQAQEQQAEPVAWDKTSASFNAWWDSYRHDPANPFAEGSAAYWAWAGWKAAQRQWVGLEPEEILDLFDGNNVYGSKWIEFARTVEAKLKEKNSD